MPGFFDRYGQGFQRGLGGRGASRLGIAGAGGAGLGQGIRAMGIGLASPFRGAAYLGRGAASGARAAAGGVRSWAASSAASRIASGAGWGAALGTIFSGGVLGGAAAGLAGVGAVVGALGPVAATSPGMRTSRAGAIARSKALDRFRHRGMAFGGKLLGAAIVGGIGNEFVGPLGGIAAAGAVLAPGTAARIGAAGFNAAAGTIGLGGRAMIGGAGMLSNRFGRGLVGAVVGGAMGGLPGVGVGALAGMAGVGSFTNTRPARGLARMLGTRPGVAGALIGGILALPTIARGALGAAAPDPVMMDIGMGSNAAVMGLDGNNANTLGLTLALHYRR